MKNRFRYKVTGLYAGVYVTKRFKYLKSAGEFARSLKQLEVYDIVNNIIMYDNKLGIVSACVEYELGLKDENNADSISGLYADNEYGDTVNTIKERS